MPATPAQIVRLCVFLCDGVEEFLITAGVIVCVLLFGGAGLEILLAVA